MNCTNVLRGYTLYIIPSNYEWSIISSSSDPVAIGCQVNVKQLDLKFGNWRVENVARRRWSLSNGHRDNPHEEDANAQTLSDIDSDARGNGCNDRRPLSCRRDGPQRVAHGSR